MCNLSDKVFFVIFQQELHLWLGLRDFVGASKYIASASIALYLIACLSIPIPTSKIERLSPVFCFFLLLPFFALRVMFLIWSFSVAMRRSAYAQIVVLRRLATRSRRAQLTISTAWWWTQFWRLLATFRFNLARRLWVFFHRLDAPNALRFPLWMHSEWVATLIFLFSGFLFLLNCLDILLIWDWASLRNLGGSILPPLLSAIAVLQPKSSPIAPTPVSLWGTHLTVMLANHLPLR